MSQITATTTRTSTSLLARTIGAGASSRGGTGTASHIRQQVQIPDYGGSQGGEPSFGKSNKGKGTDPPPGPNLGDGSGGGGGGGGGNPGGGGGGGNPGGGGGGGDPPNPDAAGEAPPYPNPDRISDKLIGNEPKIFNGERDQVEEFLTSWNLYQGLN